MTLRHSIVQSLRIFNFFFIAKRLKIRGFKWVLWSGGKRLVLFAFFITLVIPAAIMALAGIRIIRSDTLLYRMGNVVHQPELFVKSVLLGWTPQYRPVILAPKGKSVNDWILRYWGRYFKVISNPILARLLSPFESIHFLQFDSGFVTLAAGSRLKPVPAVYSVEEAYQSRFGERPLLTTTKEDLEYGWSVLEKYGVPRDAWFVCLHVREGGYLPKLNYHSYRDADITDYLLAAEKIIERGGWVIRMGDTSMTPYSPNERFIDYATNGMNNDRMDIFCFSQARFVLGTTSGAVQASKVFGIPAVQTNYVPMGHGVYSARDIWIPKLYWSIAENRYFTFGEVLLHPMRIFSRTEQYEAEGIRLIDNTPEEIADLTCEMLDRLDGDITYTDEDETLQTQFHSLLAADPMYAATARVGRDFLRKYSSQLEGSFADPGRVGG
jgi:putative glycosyltransferase (TIGR04372 family)